MINKADILLEGPSFFNCFLRLISIIISKLVSFGNERKTKKESKKGSSRSFFFFLFTFVYLLHLYYKLYKKNFKNYYLYYILKHSNQEKWQTDSTMVFGCFYALRKENIAWIRWGPKDHNSTGLSIMSNQFLLRSIRIEYYIYNILFLSGLEFDSFFYTLVQLIIT